MNTPLTHLVSAYVQNVPGVSVRIAMVFARRGYNIESFVGSETITPGFSIINIVATGDSRVLGLIIDQLNKLVNVVEAKEIEVTRAVSRELALFRVKVEHIQRTEAVMVANAAGCEVVDVHPGYMNLQCVGSTEKINGVIKIFSDFGVLELVRTGKIFLPE
ncbi:MAG: acetolactate synthase small subunit [Spirochaetales bacterium]|nr:acetolactate synthase small subunit [Spirochaetales bacterium]